jgi:hypothetical protein
MVSEVIGNLDVIRLTFTIFSWTFNRNRQRQMYGQDAGICQVGDWVLETYGDNGVLAKTVRVNLDGNGRVVYNVDDALDLIQVENHGLKCNGNK